MRTCLLAFLASLICIASIPALAAQQEQTGTLKGKVATSKGKPIEGAEVRIMASKDRSVRDTTTNSDGIYTFDLPPDEYTVSFQADGFEEGTLQTLQQVEAGKETVVKTIKLPKATRTSLIRGSVFNINGFGIAGVKVTIERVATDEETKERKHFKPLSRENYSNLHGEFAFRLPSERGKYIVTVSAHGYRDEKKEVIVNEDEAVPVAFTLLPGR